METLNIEPKEISAKSFDRMPILPDDKSEIVLGFVFFFQ